jgi:hypothetical protein
MTDDVTSYGPSSYATVGTDVVDVVVDDVVDVVLGAVDVVASNSVVDVCTVLADWAMVVVEVSLAVSPHPAKRRITRITGVNESQGNDLAI